MVSEFIKPYYKVSAGSVFFCKNGVERMREIMIMACDRN